MMREREREKKRGATRGGGGVNVIIKITLSMKEGRESARRVPIKIFISIVETNSSFERRQV